MDYTLRLAKAVQLLEKLDAEALLIDDPTNLLYLTGMELSAGKLLISSQASVLIVDGRYFESCGMQQTLYPVLKLQPDALKNWLKAHSIHSLAFDSDKTSYQAFLNLKAITDSLSMHLTPTASPLNSLRLVKDLNEIQCLKEAALLCHQGYRAIAEHLREGVSEEELAMELEIFWKLKGAKKVSFDPIIAFGANSSMPHYRAGKTKLQRNTSVLIDIGVTLSHYNSDMTRVIFFGEPVAEIQKIHTIVSKAQAKALELCKPGTLVGELDQAARGWITEQGYGEFFTHSLGHGVGLDIHEAPLIRTNSPQAQLPLEEGMVITIEPGIYLPGLGGIRLEDTLLITSTGYENLTGV